MPRYMETERKTGKDTKNQPSGAGLGMSEGLAIGMPICIAIGIVLSEVWGLYIAIPLSIVFGGATGVLIGTALERHRQRRNCQKAISTGV